MARASEPHAGDYNRQKANYEEGGKEIMAEARHADANS
jgi:hypothetical protein